MDGIECNVEHGGCVMSPNLQLKQNAGLLLINNFYKKYIFIIYIKIFCKTITTIKY